VILVRKEGRPQVDFAGRGGRELIVRLEGLVGVNSMMSVSEETW
jgi:hypothetical protein